MERGRHDVAGGSRQNRAELVMVLPVCGVCVGDGNEGCPRARVFASRDAFMRWYL